MLSHEPARELNSREISKVLGPLVTGLLQWNRAEDIATALEIWHRIVSDPASHLPLKARPTGDLVNPITDIRQMNNAETLLTVITEIERFIKERADANAISGTDLRHSYVPISVLQSWRNTLGPIHASLQTDPGE